MKTRTILLISMVLNVGLLGSVAFLGKQMPNPSYFPGTPTGSPERVMLREAQAGSGPRFGPEFETTMDDPGSGVRPFIMDLETGLRVQEPAFETFNRNARACASWIRSSGLDLSGTVVPGQFSFCISYYMAMVPVPGEAWESARADEILSSPELAAITQPKRSCFMAGETPLTYFFRTVEGTTGILQIGEVSPADKCLHIRYRLVVSDQPLVAVSNP